MADKPGDPIASAALAALRREKAVTTGTSWVMLIPYDDPMPCMRGVPWLRGPGLVYLATEEEVRRLGLEPRT